MPVRKFKSVFEMPGVRPLRPLAPDNIRAACELTELAVGLRPWRLEPGLRKFRSIEDASLYREGQSQRAVVERSP
jgi:hypothetical protein